MNKQKKSYGWNRKYELKHEVLSQEIQVFLAIITQLWDLWLQAKSLKTSLQSDL